MTKSERIQIGLAVLAIFTAVILGIPAWLTWLRIEPKDIATMTYFEIVKIFINKYWWAYWLLSFYLIAQSIVLFILSRTTRKREIDELEHLRESERAATRTMISIEGKYDATRTAIWKLYGEYINSKHRDTEQEYLWGIVKSSFENKR